MRLSAIIDIFAVFDMAKIIVVNPNDGSIFFADRH